MKNKPALWKLILIILGICMSIGAGISTILLETPYAPLAVGAGFLGIVFLFIWIKEPLWGLATGLFVTFLPAGILSDQIQSILNRSLTLIVFGCWIVNILLKRKRIRISLTAVFMIAFIVWSAITLLWAKDIGEGIDTLPIYILRLLFFILVFPDLVDTKSSLDRILRTLAVNGWLLIMICFGVLITKGYTADTRLQILAMNENETGLFFLIFMIGVLWGSVNEKGQTKAQKYLISAIYLSTAIGIIALTGSRGSALSIVIAMGAFFFWKPTRFIGKIGLLLLLLSIIFFPALYATLFERFLVTRGDTMLGNRDVLWEAAWRLIREHPVLGVGIGNGSLEILPFLNTASFASQNESVSFHNPLLAIWGDTGFIGLALYLAILISALVSFIKNFLYYRTKGQHYLISYFPFIFSIFLGFMLSWIKGGALEFHRIFYLMIALLIVPEFIRAREVMVPECDSPPDLPMQESPTTQP